METKMPQKKKVLEPSFERTCDLIYNLASTRISQKFEKWQDEQPHNSAIDYFYPTDRKLFGNLLKGKRRKDNPYLLTPKLVETIFEELDFLDKNAIYWGGEDEVSLYIGDFFTTLLLEVTACHEYTKYFMGTNLITDKEVNHFYLKFIYGNQDNFESLKDDFIDFTYNSYNYFELVDEIGEIKENCIDLKDSNKTLTFHALPEKIKIYVDKIFIPFVSGICLDNLIKETE